jgi:nicotinate phosphoribosyltransferase
MVPTELTRAISSCGSASIEEALFTDMYELTMLQAYVAENMHEESVFSLFVRRLPPRRKYLVACGLDTALEYLENLCFPREALDYLADEGSYTDEFLKWLEGFRFTGDVYAAPEGTPLFAEEPLLEVVAPIPEAQIAETFVMNQVHFQTMIASKVSRLKTAAGDAAVVDFGARRMHGIDAGLKAARAGYIAGLAATSNMLAGKVYGIPVSGTMAHSYVQAHEDELAAFRAFARLYGATVLLVDTYDTLEGVRKVVQLAREMGDAFAVQAVRLDSGDLAELARATREILDSAGLQQVGIFASGSLDDASIAAIVDSGAPIQGFGVGTALGVSEDAPALDIAYKLTSYAGAGRLKLSTGKRTLPGRKQVFRVEEGDRAVGDVIARVAEEQAGRPLLHQVMRGGERVTSAVESLDDKRERARRELLRLPPHVLSLDPQTPSYPVDLSPGMRAYLEEVKAAVAGGRR